MSKELEDMIAEWLMKDTGIQDTPLLRSTMGIGTIADRIEKDWPPEWARELVKALSDARNTLDEKDWCINADTIVAWIDNALAAVPEHVRQEK